MISIPKRLPTIIPAMKIIRLDILSPFGRRIKELLPSFSDAHRSGSTHHQSDGSCDHCNLP